MFTLDPFLPLVNRGGCLCLLGVPSLWVTTALGWASGTPQGPLQPRRCKTGPYRPQKQRYCNMNGGISFFFAATATKWISWRGLVCSHEPCVICCCLAWPFGPCFLACFQPAAESSGHLSLARQRLGLSGNKPYAPPGVSFCPITKWFAQKEGVKLWMDELHFAPPKKPCK